MTAYINAGHAQPPDVPYKDPIQDRDGILDEWLSSAQINAVSAMPWELAPRFVQGPRITPDTNWVWLERGEGHVCIGSEERAVRVREGDVVLHRAGRRATDRFRASGGTRTISIHLTATLYHRMDLISLLGFPPVVPDPDGVLGRISRNLAREYQNRAPGWKRAMDTEVTAGLLYMIRQYGSRFNPDRTRRLHRDLVRLQPAFQRLEELQASPEMTVGDLAESVHLSEVRFRKIWQRATGLPPAAFVQQSRIKQACELLRTSGDTIGHIARSCGFRDAGFFHRVFRKWMGLTPGEYRKHPY